MCNGIVPCTFLVFRGGMRRSTADVVGPLTAALWRGHGSGYSAVKGCLVFDCKGGLAPRVDASCPPEHWLLFFLFPVARVALNVLVRYDSINR